MKNTIKNESGIKWNGWALNTFTVSLASQVLSEDESSLPKNNTQES